MGVNMVSMNPNAKPYAASQENGEQKLGRSTSELAGGTTGVLSTGSRDQDSPCSYTLRRDHQTVSHGGSALEHLAEGMARGLGWVDDSNPYGQVEQLDGSEEAPAAPAAGAVPDGTLVPRGLVI